MLQQLPALPVFLTSFVGRERVTAAVVERLRLPKTRLVTLTGPGGVGKTRLAVRAAELVEPEIPDGVGYVPLAAIRDATLVIPAIAGSLGLRNLDGSQTDERLHATLADQSLLLVLDNFEQVVDAGPRLVHLLETCPRLKLLITSRTPLRVSGEQVMPIPPMTLHDGGANSVDSEAVLLFVTRASDACPDVAVDEQNAAAIAQICARLDGLPLAIELAAARSRFLPPSALLSRLDHRLSLLAGGPRDRPSRHQSMRDAIAWSHDLLAADEQRLFRRLSVFRDGFSLPAAVAVGELPESGAIEALETLVDHQLVVTSFERTEEPRYALLETIREYGEELLDLSGERDDALSRHAAFFEALAARSDVELSGPDPETLLAVLDRDRRNLQAALDRTLGQGSPDRAIAFAASLWRYWRIRGSLSEAREALEQALALPSSGTADVRAHGLRKLAYVQLLQGEIEAACGAARESHDLYRVSENMMGLAAALDVLGSVSLLAHNFDLARSRYEAALKLQRALGIPIQESGTLWNLGMLALHENDLAGARRLLERAVALARDNGACYRLAMYTLDLGRVEFAAGNLDEAYDLVLEALARFEDLGDQLDLIPALTVLGQIAGVRGEHLRAVELLTASLRLRLTLGLNRNLNDFIERLAVGAAPIDPATAIRLMAAADRHRASSGAERLPWDERAWSDTLAFMRKTLDSEAFDRGWRAGSVLNLIDAGHHAVEMLRSERIAAPERGGLARNGGDPGSFGLSPRERDVLQCLASGLSNRQIAEELYLSPGTVKRHVSSILTKLNVPSRSAAIALALRSGIAGE